jgi:hypothetical protein
MSKNKQHHPYKSLYVNRGQVYTASCDQHFAPEDGSQNPTISSQSMTSADETLASVRRPNDSRYAIESQRKREAQARAVKESTQATSADDKVAMDKMDLTQTPAPTSAPTPTLTFIPTPTLTSAPTPAPTAVRERTRHPLMESIRPSPLLDFRLPNLTNSRSDGVDCKYKYDYYVDVIANVFSSQTSGHTRKRARLSLLSMPRRKFATT